MDSSLTVWLFNAGTGCVVVVLIIFGLLIPRPTHDRALKDIAKRDAEIAKLQEALALERQRSNDANQAGLVTNQLIQGLLTVVTERGGHEAHEAHAIDHADGQALPASHPPLDLTGKDIGL